ARPKKENDPADAERHHVAASSIGPDGSTEDDRASPFAGERLRLEALDPVLFEDFERARDVERRLPALRRHQASLVLERFLRDLEVVLAQFARRLLQEEILRLEASPRVPRHAYGKLVLFRALRPRLSEFLF